MSSGFFPLANGGPRRAPSPPRPPGSGVRTASTARSSSRTQAPRRSGSPKAPPSTSRGSRPSSSPPSGPAGGPVTRLDRPAARGAALELPAVELPAPEEGSYYVFQLVGLEVVEEGGGRLGVVRDVAEGVANDVLELDTGAALPLVEACVREVDLTGGGLLVAPGLPG